ncbi:hypothetical protein [Streptacidiphilus rugosus]|uniref:hypothetical protein n=1 Tax=Streptacidiphilus rugosus TaxID=405783 RepID=UPI00055A11A7|nr:hypothetical protein [Streptacidiphilus rugosus]
MFGGQHKLVRDGVQARGVVLGVETKSVAGASSAAGAVPVRLHLRVHFDDGSTAEVSCRVGGLLRSSALAYAVGDVVPVRHAAEDRTKIVVDEPALAAERDAVQQAQQAEAVARAEQRLTGRTDPRPAAVPAADLPSDAQLLAAHRAWHAARTRARQSRAAHDRSVRAEAEPRETLRLFNQSATRSAEAKSAKAKFDALHRLRPDWTAPPEPDAAGDDGSPGGH